MPLKFELAMVTPGEPMKRQSVMCRVTAALVCAAWIVMPPFMPIYQMPSTVKSMFWFTVSAEEVYLSAASR